MPAAFYKGLREGFDSLHRYVHEADEGHTFEFTVRMRGSTIVVGEEHHTDAPEFSTLRVQTVRAWSLAEALKKASALPLSVWLAQCETCEGMGFTDEYGPASKSTIYRPCPDCPEGKAYAQRLP